MNDWMMITVCGNFYIITPSQGCRPEDHGALNDHVKEIQDMAGNVIWKRNTH